MIKENALLGRGEFDWEAGVNSPIVHTVLLENGNWKELTIPNEIQVVNYGKTNQYDTSMCVSYNSVCLPAAYVLMQQLRFGLIPPETARWLKNPTANGKSFPSYFKDGAINFSERFNGALGGTQTYGAYQYMIANSGKNFGFVPNDAFPMAENFEDNINPALVPEDLLALGREFKKHLAFNYEWVDKCETAEYSKYSPLGCIGQFANYDKPDDILNPPGDRGHAMCQVLETDLFREINDSYWQEFKKYKKDKLQSFMALYFTPLKTTMDTKQWIIDNDKKWVQISAGEGGGQFGRVLQGKLRMVSSADRGTLMLLDDKMRTEPSVKITAGELDQLKAADLVEKF